MIITSLCPPLTVTIIHYMLVGNLLLNSKASPPWSQKSNTFSGQRGWLRDDLAATSTTCIHHLLL